MTSNYQHRVYNWGIYGAPVHHAALYLMLKFPDEDLFRRYKNDLPFFDKHMSERTWYEYLDTEQELKAKFSDYWQDIAALKSFFQQEAIATVTNEDTRGLDYASPKKARAILEAICFWELTQNMAAERSDKLLQPELKSYLSKQSSFQKAAARTKKHPDDVFKMTVEVKYFREPGNTTCARFEHERYLRTLYSVLSLQGDEKALKNVFVDFDEDISEATIDIYAGKDLSRYINFLYCGPDIEHCNLKTEKLVSGVKKPEPASSKPDIKFQSKRSPLKRK
mgnify:CR=1 FL=1